MTYDPSNIDQLTPSYLAAYGLTEAPFSEKQDDRFLYLTTSLNERLELIKHYTQYGNLLLLITGERGIGKSTIKQHLINTAQEEWKVCQIQSHTMMDASLLLRQVANGFGITEPPLDPSSIFEVLSNQIEHLHQESFIPILFVDDAHELPLDSLKSLFYLAEHHSEQNTALRIILFCEPEIETMLEDPAIHSLKERVTHSMEISPLDEEQTAEYLRHRLAVAGLDGTSPFTPKLIHKIFKASEGVPLKINNYAHQNLSDDSEPFISEERELESESIDSITPFNLRNTVLGGIAVAIIFAVLFYQDQINSLFEEDENTVVISNTESEPSSNTNNLTSSEIIRTPIVKNNSINEPAKVKTIELNLNNDIASTNEPIKNIEQQPSLTKQIDKTPATIKLSSVNPNPVATSKQRQIISISGEGFHKRQKVKVSWTGKEKILADTQVNVTSDSYMNLILNTGTKEDTWTITVIDTALNLESNTISFDVIANKESVTSVKKKPLIKEKTKSLSNKKKIATSINNKIILKNGLYGQNWIKKQNKNYFTLQLLGTHQKNTLPRYLKKFALKDHAATFKTQRDGKDWFTLIYGNYSTKSAAQAAVNKLPKGVNKPWVRSFASILPSLSKQQNVSTAVAPITSPSNIDKANQEGWLWSQDPSHYTLQLTASENQKAIQTFIKRHKLSGKAVYFHRLRDGKDWYILVYGSYEGYSKAKQAISQLPSTIQKAKPWTRTFGAIHAELN